MKSNPIWTKWWYWLTAIILIVVVSKQY